jgi:hypothetical protein
MKPNVCFPSCKRCMRWFQGMASAGTLSQPVCVVGGRLVQVISNLLRDRPEPL